MQTAYRHHIAAFLLLTILHFHHGVAYADEVTFETIQAQWQQYRNSASTWSGSRTCSVSLDGKMIKEFHDEIKNLNGRQICTRSFSKAVSRIDNNKFYVWGANDRYSFTLSKKTTQEPWLLTTVTSRALEVDKASSIEEVRNTCDLFSSGPLGAVVDLRSIVKHPAFTVKRLVQRPKEAILEFDCQHPVEERPFFPVQSGKLFLDPDNFYVIVKGIVYSKYTENQERTECHTEYTTMGVKPMLPVASTENTITFQKNESDVTRRTAVQSRFDLMKNSASISNADFMLTAFGLPEPFPEKASSANWWWMSFSGIGILFLLIAITLIRRARTGVSN